MPFNFPIINAPDATRDFQETFAGYNHNLRISDSEFYDMKNMTGDYYPVLSPRKKRGIIEQLTNPQAIFCKDALWYIDDNVLYNNGDPVPIFSSTHEGKTCQYTLVGMGAYLLVFEQTSSGLDNGWYINTQKTSDNGLIDQTNTITATDLQPVILSLCGKDGSAYENVTVSDTAPTSPSNGAKWLDTSGDTHYLKVYAATTSMWTTVLTTYVKISYGNIGLGFKEGDAIDISGLAVSGSAKLQEQVKFLNANSIIQSIDENKGWIVITGIIDQTCNQETGSVTLARQAPLMDYICESNNRLWGCRYGLKRGGNEVVNEIYACKQADFKNWFCYAGISTDSYAASVGTDGVWTGAVHYGSSVLFFKENCIHKLYGNMPADYQLIELKLRGVQNGSELSITNVNETLFYKTATEIVCYDGSLPVSISYQLGEKQYSNAVAGSIGSKYYISMQDDSGAWSLFVYDMQKQMWHKEDNLHVRQFCKVGSQLFAIDDNDRLIEINGASNLEPDFEWYAETGYIGYSYSDNKYVGRMIVRLSKPLTSRIRLLISYDNSEEWETVSDLNGIGTRSCSIPVLPRRCDRFRIRLEGIGDCKIYSISKALEIGSDMN
ncbi:MAG: hypothetical protein II395_03435 [Ruminococcus sp.]|nr:hypothetical protein [Ruminococcus sp.]